MKRLLYLLFLLVLLPFAGAGESSAAVSAACNDSTHTGTSSDEHFFATDIYGNDAAIIETSFNPFAGSAASYGRTKRNAPAWQLWAGILSAATPATARICHYSRAAGNSLCTLQARTGRSILSLCSRLLI